MQDRIIFWAETIKGWNIPWKTGIFPMEMAYFLAAAENCKTIIDSGRGPDAYSTQILDRYVETTGAKVYSTDFAAPESIHLSCKNVTLLTGDTKKLMPSVLGDEPAALLLDGPKEFIANKLSSTAASLFNVKVVAHHNCFLDSPWGKEFKHYFPTAAHYEDLPVSQTPEFKALKEWEIAHTQNYEMKDKKGNTGRSMERSSLALAVLDKPVAAKKGLLYWNWKLRYGR